MFAVQSATEVTIHPQYRTTEQRSFKVYLLTIYFAIHTATDFYKNTKIF